MTQIKDNAVSDEVQINNNSAFQWQAGEKKEGNSDKWSQTNETI